MFFNLPVDFFKLNQPIFCCCRTPKNSQMLGSIMTNSISTRRIKRKNKGKYSFQLKPYNSEFKPPGPKDLVYYELSPGFCDRNPGLGIQGSLLLKAYCMTGNVTVSFVPGTYGRQCNETSEGVDNCAIMCCGRGYRSQEVIVKERCNCTFHWCCEVKCDTCTSKKKIHTCV